jgi:basic membrane protein A
VDSNQNHIQPGTMLTSMVKKVEVAVYEAAQAWKPGAVVLGLKENAVEYALDKNNEKLVAPEVKKRVDQAREEIIAGKIKVNDFMSEPAACAK